MDVGGFCLVGLVGALGVCLFGRLITGDPGDGKSLAKCIVC